MILRPPNASIKKPKEPKLIQKTVCEISVEKLHKICYPNGNIFETPPWGCAPFTEWDVYEARRYGQELKTPVPKHSLGDNRLNVARIAYFAGLYEFPPIAVSIHKNDVSIIDGHHRFCAAIYLGSEFIEAELSGDIDVIERLFGISC